ncbi:hypothetical protein CO667_21955 [Rhizobium sp. L43]|nr:hypothetical protein CO667_21955 [Rhizobium sp. L43]
MKRWERAVDDCAENAAFLPSQTEVIGISVDAMERFGEMAMLASFDIYLFSAFLRGATARLSSKPVDQ